MSRRRRSLRDESEMAIDPMVDVVFLLLIFFLFSFQVRMIESLYDVQVASLAPSDRPPDTPPLKLTLQSRPDGSLQAVLLNDQRLDSLAGLPAALAARKEPLTEPVLLQPSGQLEYEHVVEAALAVRQAGRVVSLLEATDAQQKPEFENPKS